MEEFQGAPKSWKKLCDDESRFRLSLINPNYTFGAGYKSNCVNCVMAYELRQRGYDVIAKSTQECNVSRKATEMWYNVIEHTANSFNDIMVNIDLNINARYFLGVRYPNGDGHALVFVVSEQQITIIDAQIGCSYSLSDLNKSSINQFSYFRIDNLEITQTGYNACKGGN